MTAWYENWQDEGPVSFPCYFVLTNVFDEEWGYFHYYTTEFLNYAIITLCVNSSHKKINEKSHLVWLETSSSLSHIQAVLRYFPMMGRKIMLEKNNSIFRE